MDEKTTKSYYSTVYHVALALKSLVGDLMWNETKTANNKEFDDDTRRKASRRASLLQNTYAAAFTIIEAIEDINNDDGVADLEEYWEIKDNEFNKDAAENA